MVLLILTDWPANSPDLNPRGESTGYCQAEDQRHQTWQYSRAEGRWNQGTRNTSAVPQADRLRATPLMLSVVQNKQNDQVLNEHTFQKVDISVL